MIKINKIALTSFLFIAFISFCRSQPVIDAKLSSQFQAAVNKVPLEFRRMFSKEAISILGGEETDKNDPIGFGILTYYKIDTLNISDLTLKGNSRIIVTDVDSDYTSVTDTESEMPLHPYFPNFMVGAMLSKDTLIIKWSELGGVSISTKIINNKVSTIYSDYQRHDDVFRINLKDPKTSQITLQATTFSCKLSNIDWKVGNIIYGETEIVSDPYFYDDFFFKDGYMKKRVHYKYIFKLRIQKPTQ